MSFHLLLINWLNNSFENLVNNAIHYKDIIVKFNEGYNSQANVFAGLYNWGNDADLNGKHILAVTSIGFGANIDALLSFEIAEDSKVIYFTTNVNCTIYSINVRITYTN